MARLATWGRRDSARSLHHTRQSAFATENRGFAPRGRRSAQGWPSSCRGNPRPERARRIEALTDFLIFVEGDSSSLRSCYAVRRSYFNDLLIVEQRVEYLKRFVGLWQGAAHAETY